MKVDCNSRGKLDFIHGTLQQQMSSTYERLNSNYPTSPNQPPVTDFQSLYKLKGLLGQGAFGVVLLVFNKHTEEESALKIINKSRLSSEAMEFLANEAHILKSLSYPPTASDN
jgi:serine/threonine protein kinase